MKSKLRVLVGGLGLCLVITLCVYWLLMTRALAGAGAPLLDGGLRGARGRLAFLAGLRATSGLDIILINADGSNRTPLPTVGDTVTWSPDGARLAIARCCIDSRSSIAVINADSSGLTQVTDNGSVPIWSPDGTRLAFVSDEADHRTSISVVYANGTRLQKLTLDGDAPAWSPDGTRVAFATYRDNHAQSISVINADGSGLTQVTNGIAGGPLWSPDGARIAFVSSNAGHAGIYVMHADGSNLIRLTDDPRAGTNLAWSPDSTRLVFGSLLWHDSHPSLYVASADGTQLTHLTNSWGIDMSPIWSPDGTRIAFRRNPWTIGSDVLNEQEAKGAGIFVIGADGSGLTRLTPASVEVDAGPVWSPDGRMLVFTAAEGQHRDELYRQANVPTGVFIVAADGSAMARLAEEGVAPAWMPERTDTR